MHTGNLKSAVYVMWFMLGKGFKMLTAAKRLFDLNYIDIIVSAHHVITAFTYHLPLWDFSKS